VVHAVPFLILSIAHGALRFLGNPQCPTAEAVEAQLRALSPASLDGAESHLVLLETRPDGLQMQLFDERGRLLEQRLMPGPMDCEMGARFAAAVLATWETNLAVVGQPNPPAVTTTPAAKATESETPAPHRDPWRWEAGLGLSGFLAGNGTFALGGELLGVLAPPHGAFGGELSLVGTGIRSLTVGTGSANWQRYYLGLGGEAELGHDALRLQLGAAFLFGLLSLSGTGYTESFSSSVFDPGIGVSARAIWRFEPSLAAWLQLGASLWLKAQEVQVLDGANTYTARVPPVDLSLSVGLSLVGEPRK
jgi:hypothetical protein